MCYIGKIDDHFILMMNNLLMNTVKQFILFVNNYCKKNFSKRVYVSVTSLATMP